MNTVKELLSSKGSAVFTIAPDSTVYDALVVMDQKGVGALVVVAGGKVAGIISERDYARKVILKNKFSKNIPVSEIMSPSPMTVTPAQSIKECMGLMTENHYRHLPVVDSGKLVGIISIGDLVKAIISSQQALIKDLENYIAGAPEVL